MITEASQPTLQNIPIAQQHIFSVAFPSNQLTIPTGQTFSHIIDIYSAVDYKLICAVKTNIAIAANGAVEISKVISTDELKCHTIPRRFDKKFNSDVVVFEGDIGRGPLDIFNYFFI